ncbi:hypothetical protein [Actinomadura terrae]|uniref:hypothetical protein n=1 Tax=Actinomadura terrae TaxID=604353 RepID=UPI001FA725FC|nr:hypothetical protein [Actinomadura terrae]
MVSYTVLIEVRYAGAQTVEREAARRALAAALDGPDTSDGPGNTLQLRTTLDADGPRAAVEHADEALTRALLATGLFEEFDMARRVLHVAPADLAEHLFAWSPDHSPTTRAANARRTRGPAWLRRMRRRLGSGAG